MKKTILLAAIFSMSVIDNFGVKPTYALSYNVLDMESEFTLIEPVITEKATELPDSAFSNCDLIDYYYKGYIDEQEKKLPITCTQLKRNIHKPKTSPKIQELSPNGYLSNSFINP